MSAWIVSKKHIDLLVTAYLDAGFVLPGSLARHAEDPDALGALLWAENHKSVNDRYGQRTRTPRYKFARYSTPDPVFIIKQVQCYEYQSCEHDGWGASEAKRICAALIDRLIGRLPGYDTAPWGM